MRVFADYQQTDLKKMKFDTIIIGGGLTGLVCGIKLSQQGQKCIIISNGQSALHFSSGSFDLLNNMPDGSIVHNPCESISELIKTSPLHPYRKTGIEKISQLAVKGKEILMQAGIPVQGDSAENHFRITPLGTRKPTWLTLSDLFTPDKKDSLPWKKAAIFNISGFLDFHPAFIADEFRRQGTDCEIHHFSLPDLDILRRNPGEMRSTNIARVFEHKKNMEQLVEILISGSKDAEAIVFPSIIGLSDLDTRYFLNSSAGKAVCIIPTLPPSILGIRTQKQLHNYFVKLGGVYMLGDRIINGEYQNEKIKCVYSRNHGDIPFAGQNFVLAGGSFFSQGMVATNGSVFEPVFDLDVSFLTDRQGWYNKNMFGKQPFHSFGVQSSDNFKGIKQGKEIGNLYIAGSILEGFDPIKEGSGGGVSIITALNVAESIINGG
jgi:glycerol-3-phosphate dehydrogenase subunit B